MRKLLFVITTILGVALLSALERPISKLDNINSENILYKSLPDSLYSLIKHKSEIFYAYGHYGYSWSLIAMILVDDKI